MYVYLPTYPPTYLPTDVTSRTAPADVPNQNPKARKPIFRSKMFRSSEMPAQGSPRCLGIQGLGVTGTSFGFMMVYVV